jgi:Fe-S cluster assembly scaffold protein SufB
MAVKTRVNVRAWSETTPGGTEYYIDGNKVVGVGATIPLANLADFTRGDLIVGGAVQWQDLAHPGAAGRVLTTDATDTLWSAYTITGTTGGTTTLAVSKTKTLTLTAADSYNLTAAKTGTLPVGTGTAGRVAEWVTDANTLQASTLAKSGAGVLTLRTTTNNTITVTGNVDLDDWFDQSVKQAASPQFAYVKIVGNGDKFALFEDDVAEASAYIKLTNATGGAGILVPYLAIRGNVTGAGYNSLFEAICNSDQATDTGAVMVYRASYGSAVVTKRPLYQWQNYTTAIMTITNSGNILIGTTTDGMTAAGSLAIAKDLAHRGTRAGFFNTAPATKPTVTGSRGGNAALASLLTALAGLGLLTDSTT